MDAQIEVLQGRIERLAVDAVVNAANRQLLPGAGVDGALRAAAGPELTKLTETLAPLEAGVAVITPGFDGPFKHIIHVAAPIWHSPGREQEKIWELATCYESAMTLAQHSGLTSIGFPSLGTGIYGWPKDLACGIALKHVSAALTDAPSIERVVFCCFTEADTELYRSALRDLR